jgi:putative transcriptional regulator
MIFGVVKFRLAELLKKEGKTLYRVAKDTGIAYNTLHSLKNGEKIDIRLSTLERLCQSLNCTPNDLITFSK